MAGKDSGMWSSITAGPASQQPDAKQGLAEVDEVVDNDRINLWMLLEMMGSLPLPHHLRSMPYHLGTLVWKKTHGISNTLLVQAWFYDSYDPIISTPSWIWVYSNNSGVSHSFLAWCDFVRCSLANASCSPLILCTPSETTKSALLFQTDSKAWNDEVTKRTTNVDLKLFSVEACDQSYRAGDLLELTWGFCRGGRSIKSCQVSWISTLCVWTCLKFLWEKSWGE